MKTKTLMIKKLLLVLLFSTFYQSIFAQDFKVVGYLPSYRLSILDRINYDFYTHLIASFINPDENGDISWDGDMENFVNTVHENGTLAIASFGGGGDYSWGDEVSIYENLLATQESRTNFIHKIMNYLREHDLDGIDNDMEGYALELDNYNVFTQELGDSVHAVGLEFSAAYGVEAYWGAGIVTDATLQKFDFIGTMSYGGVGFWNWGNRNDENTLEKFESDHQYFVNRGVASEKVIGGIAFYTVEFPATAQTNYNHFHKTLCDTYNDPRLTGIDVPNQDTIYTEEGSVIYLNSLNTLKRKIDIAKENNSGIMIWEVGQECFDRSYALTDSLLEYMHSINLLSNNETQSKPEFKVYPNPATNMISVEGKNIQTITVMNIQGKVINALTPRNNEVSQVDVSRLTSGIYILRVQFVEGITIQEKLIIK
jgi:hypothetical protein